MSTMQQASDEMPRGSTATPPMVRFAILAAVAVLAVGAVYLVAVRGEALLADLAAIGSKVWCF